MASANGLSPGLANGAGSMPLSPSTHVSSSSFRSSRSAAGSSTQRRSFLDESALSPHEYVVYTASFASIKPAASGQAGLIDEADALRYLREQCSMEMEDELEILSLFERTPRGLASGHFYAMLRLVSWAQQGQTATKQLLFTQTSPVRITPKKSTPQTPSVASFASPQSVVSPTPRSHTSYSAAPIPTPAPPKVAPPKPEAHSKPPLPPVREESASSLQRPSMPTPSASAPTQPPAVPAKPSMPNLVAPRPKHASMAPPINLTETRKLSAPQPPASANPFRDGASTAFSPAPTGTLMGFDPAPNPFKQSKPRLVKPTPVRASSPASNPFRNGTPAVAHPHSAPRVILDHADDARSSVASSSKSKHLDRATSPPLPPRPMLNPPPLPPRHISPLIQAGLHARSEVQRAKQALPPKTFTVLQSSSSKHHIPEKKPRLLNGQTAPPDVVLPPPPQHHAKRRSVSGQKAFAEGGGDESAVSDNRRAVSEAVSHRRGSGSVSEEHQSGVSRAGASRRRGSGAIGNGGTDNGAAAEGPGMPSKQLPKVVAPKASYPAQDNRVVSKGKGTLPSWLKEQEELQREALASGEELPAPPPLHNADTNRPPTRTVLDDLDDEASAMSDEARAGASIERNNPFFPPPSLGRSKTLGANSGALPPPRRRLDSFPQQNWGATLDSGTYAGFKPNKEQPNSGGLRLVPPSKQAKMAAEELEQENIRPADDVPPGSASSSDGAMSPSTPNAMRRQSSLIRERVSDILRIQDAPPKGQRPVDILTNDIQALVQKHDWLARAAGKPLPSDRARLIDSDDPPEPDLPLRRSGSLNPKRSASYSMTNTSQQQGSIGNRRWSSYANTQRPARGGDVGHDSALDVEEEEERDYERLE